MSTTPSSRPGRRRDPALAQRWRQRLLRFEQSGQSVSAFCAAEGVSTPSFYPWRRRLGPSSAAGNPPCPPRGQAQARLLPVHLLPPSAAVEVVLPSGALLRLPPDCDL